MQISQELSSSIVTADEGVQNNAGVHHDLHDLQTGACITGSRLASGCFAYQWHHCKQVQTKHKPKRDETDAK